MPDAFPGLGFDPAPGSPDAAMAVAAEYLTAADALDQVNPAVRRARAATEGWTGPAATAFTVHLADLPANPADRATALRAAADALASWAQTLAESRRAADDLERQAVLVRRQVADAEDDLHQRRGELDLAATSSAAAQAGLPHAAAESALADLRDRLEAVLAQARTLAADHNHAADELADRLDSLHGAAPTQASNPARSIADLLDRVSTTSATLAALVTRAPSGIVGSGGAARLASVLSSAGASEFTRGEAIHIGESR
ncbi:hypothetical protein [Actinokineospora enzanensis]|uniref:hypothetical protein n=1 Tax=Actinokineospora enzanensis TaxID=155975 RepID=UPI000373C891|nr:hypothetical protein [Actinokineospora enzanensis]